ncbi:MAG: hypothetical protein MJZ34_02380 [Paludibacteraceae bacterium]|nr:hypothetical protein [Paludibacteraceae bacterium]
MQEMLINDETQIHVKVFYNYQIRCLDIRFDKTFYVHKEIVESINYYLQQFALNKVIDDKMIFDVCTWMKNFLDLSYKIGILKLDPFTGCKTIESSY